MTFVTKRHSTGRRRGRDGESSLLLESVDFLVKVKDKVSAIGDLEAIRSQLRKTFI